MSAGNQAGGQGGGSSKLKRLLCGPSGQVLLTDPELRLYSENFHGHYIGTPDAKSLRCLDWSFKHSPAFPLLALSYATGRTLLGRLNSNDNDFGEIQFLSSLTPRQSRATNDVAFCPLNPRLLATGLDKVRNDCGLLIWDLETSLSTPFPTGSSSTLNLNSTEAEAVRQSVAHQAMNDGEEYNLAAISKIPQRPIAQYGSSEGVISLSWFQTDSDRIVAGMSLKTIRLFDLRVSTEAINSQVIISTKAVQGIKTDPFSIHRWASFADDGIVRIFDARKPVDPVLSFNSEYRNGLGQLSWCPSRSGLLGTIGRDSPVIKVWNLADIHHSVSQSVGHDLEKDATFTAREDFFLNQDTAPELEHIPIVTNVWKATYNEKRIYSFAWAPTPSPSSAFVNSHKLIVLGNKAKYEKIRILTGHAFSVSSLSHICISNGQHVRESALMPPGVEDIGDIMYRRACTGYSLYAHKNIEILEESSLREVWGWIADMKSIELKDTLQGAKGRKYNDGVLSCITKSLHESQTTVSSHVDLGLPFKSYMSEGRRQALVLSGWSFYLQEDDQIAAVIEENISALESIGEYILAAALAFFHGCSLVRAVQCLNKSKDQTIQLIALALAGGNTSSSTWKTLCGAMNLDLRHPYIRSIFSLVATGDWNTVLADKELSLKDRLGMALRFLDDEELLALVEKWSSKSLLIGNIQGFILTGWTNNGMQLLSQYLDNTGDVQSVALLVGCNTILQKQFKRVEGWIETYRNLLDQWQLHKNRAHFDIQRSKTETTLRGPKFQVIPASQVYIRCNYCSTSLSAGHLAVSSTQSLYAAGRSRNVCPKCRKPLPRCSICLLHMGASLPDRSLSPIDHWFSVCMSCKHGGHMGHLASWFKTHTQCPVSDCSCLCMTSGPS